jgi:hypothetical protein
MVRLGESELALWNLLVFSYRGSRNYVRLAKQIRILGKGLQGSLPVTDKRGRTRDAAIIAFRQESGTGLVELVETE